MIFSSKKINRIISKINAIDASFGGDEGDYGGNDFGGGGGEAESMGGQGGFGGYGIGNPGTYGGQPSVGAPGFAAGYGGIGGLGADGAGGMYDVALDVGGLSRAGLDPALGGLAEAQAQSIPNRIAAGLMDFFIGQMPYGQMASMGIRAITGKTPGAHIALTAITNQVQKAHEQAMAGGATEEEAREISIEAGLREIEATDPESFGGESRKQELLRSFGTMTFGEYITNPMDIFGREAGETLGGVRGVMFRSAQEGILAQEAQRERIQELYEPFYRGAVEGALPQLQAMAEGGEIEYTPSRLYEYQRERGERDIRRQMAARGLAASSAQAQRLSDLRLSLAQEEMDRLYSGQLSRLQLGAGAAGAISAAGGAIGRNIAGIYGGLGTGLAAAQQQYGLARQSAYRGLASALGGLATWMEA